MAVPGMAGGAYVAAGIEHNELGDPTSSGEVHERMNEKRSRKLEPLRSREDLVLRFGREDARLGVISWGSTVSALRELIKPDAMGRFALRGCNRSACWSRTSFIR